MDAPTNKYSAMNKITNRLDHRFVRKYVAVAVTLVLASLSATGVSAAELTTDGSAEPLPKLVDPAGIIDPELLEILNAMSETSDVSFDDFSDEETATGEPALGAAMTAAEMTKDDAVAGEVLTGETASIFDPVSVPKTITGAHLSSVQSDEVSAGVVEETIADQKKKLANNKSNKANAIVEKAQSSNTEKNNSTEVVAEIEEFSEEKIPMPDIPTIVLDDENLEKLAFGEVLRMTLADNPGIFMAEERVEQAVQNARQVGSYRYPIVALTSSLGPEYNDPVASEDSGVATTLGKNIKVTATKLLFDGGSAKANYVRSNRLINAAEAESQIAVEELFVEVVNHYVDYWKFQREHAQAKTFVDTMNDLVDDLNSMFEAGATSKLEVDFARARVASARGAQSEATASLNNSFSELEFLVPGLTRFLASSPSTFSEFNLLGLQEYLDNGAQANSAFLINKMNSEASRLKIDAANGLFKPTLNVELSGSFIDDEGQPSDNRYKAAAKFLVNYTFYSGGERRGGLRRAEAQLRELEAEKRQLERDVFRDIDQSYNSITASRLALDAVSDEIAAHEELQRLNKQNLALGTVNIIELIDVEERLFNANARKNEVIATMYQEYFSLLIAAGHTQEVLSRFELELVSSE